MRFVFLLLLMFALPAHAAVKIVNLDDVPHIVVINNAGERSEVRLEPNRSYVTYGPMVDIGIRGEKKLIRAHIYGEYVIWKGGKLVLQRIREPRNSR
jgi:S-adenosylmethionine synthetase